MKLTVGIVSTTGEKSVAYTLSTVNFCVWDMLPSIVLIVTVRDVMLKI